MKKPKNRFTVNCSTRLKKNLRLSPISMIRRVWSFYISEIPFLTLSSPPGDPIGFSGPKVPQDCGFWFIKADTITGWTQKCQKWNLDAKKQQTSKFRGCLTIFRFLNLFEPKKRETSILTILDLQFRRNRGFLVPIFALHRLLWRKFAGNLHQKQAWLLWIWRSAVMKKPKNRITVNCSTRFSKKSSTLSNLDDTSGM